MVLKCYTAWYSKMKAERLAADLLSQEEKKRQTVEEQLQKSQEDLTVQVAARKTAEAEARTATELLHSNGIQLPNEKEKSVRERALLPVERIAAALQRVYRRRLTGALVAMLTKSPRRLAWYERVSEHPQLALDQSKLKAPLALPSHGSVASTLDFLARAQQGLVDGQNRQSLATQDR